MIAGTPYAFSFVLLQEEYVHRDNQNVEVSKKVPIGGKHSKTAKWKETDNGNSTVERRKVNERMQ